jgi:hypothetical protein
VNRPKPPAAGLGPSPSTAVRRGAASLPALPTAGLDLFPLTADGKGPSSGPPKKSWISVSTTNGKRKRAHPWTIVQRTTHLLEHAPLTGADDALGDLAVTVPPMLLTKGAFGVVHRIRPRDEGLRKLIRRVGLIALYIGGLLRLRPDWRRLRSRHTHSLRCLAVPNLCLREQLRRLHQRNVRRCDGHPNSDQGVLGQPAPNLLDGQMENRAGDTPTHQEVLHRRPVALRHSRC